jgi:sortase A
VNIALMRTRTVEVVLLGTGVALLSAWGGAWIYSTVSSRAAVKRFERERAQLPTVESSAVNDHASELPVDFSLWSTKRVAAYQDSLLKAQDHPLAVLRIPKIHLEVPVYNDTEDLTLDRGVGRILGTAQVGQAGNLGIAGHRDGFFRGLKDLAQNDTIELDRVGQSDTYTVASIEIVSPDDVSVLDSTPEPSMTLVTCFPFYFVGSAPQRYVVHAYLTGPDRSHAEVSQSKSAVAGNNTKENQR